MAYKSVKIPEWAYENVLAARGELARRGLNALDPDVLAPPTCPRCKGPVELAAQKVQCHACGYRQEAVMESAGGGGASLALGVLIGLGIAALLSSIDGDERDRRRG